MPRESCQLCASCAKSPLPSPGPALAVSAVLLEPGRPAHGTPPPAPPGLPSPPASAGVRWSLPEPGSPGLASVNLLSGCLSKPIKTNH